LQAVKDNGQLLSNLIRSPILWDFLDSHGGDSSFKQTLEINAPNSERILSIRLIPYGQKYLLIARDITSIKKLKTMRKDFVANVSHELRTPLTVISGYLETLEEHLKEEPVYASSIHLMQQQSYRMCHIIEDLLLLSKIESSEKRVLKNDFIDMNALLMMLKKEALVLSHEQQIITIENTGKKWLKGDINELQSAFSNLISNAIRYTPKGGEIIIRWSRDDDSEMACFEVQDNGEGIAKQHVLRLTERFYRVDVGRSRKIGGTGLGLAIVKHVLAHHHSKLEIESEIGVGSTFRCKFPDNMLKSDK
jgi:two-component system phosphate regulon sensor histidine kinase PhoR